MNVHRTMSLLLLTTGVATAQPEFEYVKRDTREASRSATIGRMDADNFAEAVTDPAGFAATRGGAGDPSRIDLKPFAVARIDTGSFSEKDIVAKVTFDDRPSMANQQKREFQKRVDDFVRTVKPASYTDITGGILQATEYLNEKDPGENDPRSEQLTGAETLTER